MLGGVVEAEMHVLAEGLAAMERKPLGSRRAVKGFLRSLAARLTRRGDEQHDAVRKRRLRTQTLKHTDVSTMPVELELALVKRGLAGPLHRGLHALPEHGATQLWTRRSTTTP